MNSNRCSITAYLILGLVFAVASGWLLLAAPRARAAVDKPDAACLYTQAELVRVLGSAIGAGEPYEVKMGSRHIGWSCRYPGKAVKLDVSVEASDASRFEKDRQLAEHLAQPHQFHLLIGVGEAAFVGQGGIVEVLSGGRKLSLMHLTLASGHTVSDADIHTLVKMGLERMAKLNVAGR
jgi:hypothetical protein